MLTFKVVSIEGKPYVEVRHEGETKQFSPEQISSMILSKLKRIASNYLGEEITDAVITVPAYFNDSQRQSTKDAGRIAGLNVLRIINEPTAAALAYGLDKQNSSELNVLIFDMGGGTTDITLLTLEDGLFQVRATSGDSHLGGEDIDNRLVDYCVQQFQRKYNIDPCNSPRSIRRLRTACENAKRILSTSNQTTIEVDSFYEGHDLSISLSRTKFDELCMDVFRAALAPVNKVLNDAEISKDNIHEIVLVGGSTRIPKIRLMLSDFFGGKKLNESVNPDEAVAYGAAIQAAILSGESHDKINDIVLVDVTPLSLGIETAGGIMVNIIDRNSTIPCKKSRIFSTYSDNQTTVNIQIFEGERKFTKDNNSLGTFSLEGITPAPRGVPQIEVTFDIDANGILNVTACDKANQKSKNLVITNNRGRFTEDQIQKMIEEAKQFEEADNKRKAAIEERNQLENYLHTVKSAVADSANKEFIDEESRTKLENMFDEFNRFIEENPNEEKEVYENKRKELEDLWNPIAVKMYSKSNSEEEK
jgi:heat shock protein 1/8